MLNYGKALTEVQQNPCMVIKLGQGFIDDNRSMIRFFHVDVTLHMIITKTQAILIRIILSLF